MHSSVIDAPGELLDCPLVVDLDETLLQTDTLIESVAAGLARQPRGTLYAVGALVGGRAALKSALAEAVSLDVDTLPENADLVKYLRVQAAQGREIHLVSAADERVVQAVAERFGFFASAYGSSRQRNLKGKNKASFLAERFPEGFVYAGDSKADIAVWRVARGALLVGVSEATAKAAQRLCPVERSFPGKGGSLKDWRKQFRLHQWAKNGLLFAAIFLGGVYLDPESWARTILGFLFFSLMASATYVVNDLFDLEADRRHPTKRHRPLASGRIRIIQAAPAALFAGLVSIFGMAALGVGALLTLLFYTAITLAYSFYLKRIPMLDVGVLALLFTTRIVLGAHLAHVALSEWLLVFSMFFFLSLSIAKRYVEVARRAKVINGGIPGRGYETGDVAMLLSFGVGTSVAALLTMCVYLLEAAYPSGVYGAPEFLWLTVIAIALWCMRIWLLAHREKLDDDPVAFAVKDRLSYGVGALAVVGFTAAVVL